MLKTIIFIVVSYLVGSVSSASVICNKFYSTDIRRYGSGNPGSTNVLRVLGPKPAAMVFAADFAKGFVMVLLGKLVGGESLALLSAIAVVIGHDWSIFLGFKGGKGIATSFGAILVLTPKVALILFVIGIVVIALSRYVSLGSVTAAVLYPILVIAFDYPLNYIMTGLVLGLIAIYRHKENIKRLMAGKENKLVLKKR
ncbi:glycerol-3-phosphate acyltransferase 2 [Tepidanaerobacter syntrophicus]|uniref:glycerol-3-phosphate 1-O-acyltransferase PlsY n=1 Tax=Tepidanaerobacter syntrophicus TaxID=224999 RepID=UPI0022EEC0F7|nr:glycerol-3-phosphate 1-O-acyltransferase PlsY [Tepidanaerobacter syntrophicus]GLI50745.1 glycerol-3-phosphate acyltransferase 2 [Tepidanaerobacter syntrophicus]